MYRILVFSLFSLLILALGTINFGSKYDFSCFAWVMVYHIYIVIRFKIFSNFLFYFFFDPWVAEATISHTNSDLLSILLLEVYIFIPNNAFCLKIFNIQKIQLLIIFWLKGTSICMMFLFLSLSSVYKVLDISLVRCT